MVLGATLSALPAQAATSEKTDQAIQDMGKYCTACWRNARLPETCWNDCTQEVLVRLLERVPTNAWGSTLRKDGEERKEFIRAIDAVKKRVQRSRKALGDVEGLADRRQSREWSLSEDREVVGRAAREVLTPRQQRILQMSFEGWDVKEIAAELALPAERISDEKYKAIRKLREHIRLT
jgi:RNA polymerase sigma factor (sigma-70 family)